MKPPRTQGFAASTARRRPLPLVLGGLAVFVVGLLFGAVLFDSGATDPPIADSTTGAPVDAGPGPRRVVSGVRVGYVRSEAGAVAAATSYVTVLSGSVVLDAARVERALNVFVAPDSLTGLAQAYRQVAEQGRDRLGLDADPQPTVVFRGSPVGYRVERYAAESAEITVWVVSVAGSSAGVAPRQSWGTTEVGLRWLQGDWKVESLQTNSGPTPPVAGAPSRSAQLFTALPRFKEYTYAQRP